MDSDDDWHPPTAAEMKIIEAKQERSNQISKLMGTYMLKGFRMLNKICPSCGTILLQDRENDKDYCVACNELETECAKDDPALSTTAAKVAVLESQSATTTSDASPNLDGLPVTNVGAEKFPRVQVQNLLDGVKQRAGDRLALYNSLDDALVITKPNNTQHERQSEMVYKAGAQKPTSHVQIRGEVDDIHDAYQILKTKLFWAAEGLKSSVSIESSIQLCNLIKACSDAIVSLGQIDHGT